MIVIPPQDPNERPSDPIAEALAPLYDQFTNVQNLAEFHAALRKRDALYEIQHQDMGESPQDFENLHPRDFYRQFDRRADEDDKAVVSEAPYRIREQLKDALWAERDTAKSRALETYKKLFIDHHLAQLDRDRLYYLGKVADAASDQDRERYLTALIGRLKLSGEVGLLHKQDADRLIENIPSDLDIFTYNREYAADPARAQRLLLYGTYPNIRPELREGLVKAATEAVGPSMANLADEQVDSEPPAGVASPAEGDANAELKRRFTTEGIEEFLQQRAAEDDSIPNNGETSASKRENSIQQVAAAVGKAQGQAQKAAQPGKATTQASDKVKMNELGTGAEARRSQQTRPRMSDVLHGGKPESPAMNDEKENLPQTSVQRSEPSQPFTSRMKFDSRTEKYISELHPDVAVLAREHLTRIVEANTGYQVKIVKAYRSYEEQEDEYEKGRLGNPGPTVTDAGAGESPHNFRAGYDIALIDPKTQTVVKNPNDPAYQTAGRIGEELGLTWGFRFPKVDAVHFELSKTRNIDIDTMRERYESGKDIYTGQ